MVAGLIQIASAVPTNAPAIATGNQSPRSGIDLYTTFHQHMRNELGISAEEEPAGEQSTAGAQRSRNSRDAKPARGQGANCLPVRNAASDEAVVPLQLRSFSSPGPTDSGVWPGFAQPGTVTSPPNGRGVAQAIAWASLSSEPNQAENNAGRSRLPVAADPDGSGSSSSRGSGDFDAGARQHTGKDISASSPQPLQSVQAEQRPASAESKSVTRDGHGGEADSGYSTAAPASSSAASAAQPAASAEPNSPPDEQAAEGAGSTSLADAVHAARQVPATENLGDAFENLVNAAPNGRQAPSNDDLERKKDTAGAHDIASESHGMKAAAAAERKVSEAGAATVPDAAVATPVREQATPVRPPDQLAAPSFNQAFTAERLKSPAAESNAPEQGTSAAALARAAEAGEGPNPLQMQSARLSGNENQAEVQVALQTPDYGHVEIKTTLQNSTLGATITVEHSNLREQIVSALPELRHSFAERQITLDSLTVSDSLSSATSFTNSHQQRSNQQQAAVPYAGSQERQASPDWETASAKLPEPVLQPWAGDSGSELNVLV